MLNPISVVTDLERPNKKLLIVDDDRHDQQYFKLLLRKFNHDFDEVICVGSLDEAWQELTENKPAFCLLDLHLPDGNAVALLNRIKRNFDLMPCPLVVVTSMDDVEMAVKVLHSGAQDYLVKDKLDQESLQRILQSASNTWSLQQQLKHLALNDALTGLPNRTLFIDRLKQLFESNRRYKRPFALLYIDVDKFKQTNDAYGHDVGDEVLGLLSEQLSSALRTADTAARLGGDEFAVLLPDTDTKKAELVANKLIDALIIKLPGLQDNEPVTCSIGVAMFPSGANTYQELMREADFALYQAKKSGRSQYACFDKSLGVEIQNLNILGAALPRAIFSKQLQVAYQPIVRAKTGKLVSVEALVRWRFKNQWVSPEKIIELVLKRKMSEQFHTWLFEETMKQLAVWHRTKPDLNMAVNLPANLCHDPAIFAILTKTIEKVGISPHTVTVEVTETHSFNQPKETVMRLREICDYGIQVAIDDFGKGYSSMDYLASLPCHKLKIDQQFFRQLDTNERNGRIIEAITALSHRLGLKVVAEGIETPTLLASARHYGCDFVQGYWVGAPVFSNEALDLFCESAKKEGQRLIAC